MPELPHGSESSFELGLELPHGSQSSSQRDTRVTVSADPMRGPSDDTLAAVIRVFPWNNGITLLHGSMATTLYSLWHSQGARPMAAQNSLLLVSLLVRVLVLAFFQCSPTSTDASSSPGRLKPPMSGQSR
jgi:hypothetical protein